MTIVTIIIGAVAMFAMGAILVFYALHLRDLFVTDAPYIPLDGKALACFLHNLPDLKSKTFYELGCGDGKVLSAIYDRHSASRLVGIERGWRPYILARLRLRQLIRTGNVKLVYNDIRQVDLSGADVVFTYLMDDMMAGLLPKFESELKGGTVVISVQFKLGDKKPYKTIEVSDGSAIADKLYFYRF